MSGELKLQEIRQGSHSIHYGGVVETERGDIPIHNEEPYELDGRTYFFETGWIGSPDSMRLPMCEAAQQHYSAITLEHIGISPFDAIQRNANELAATIQVVPDSQGKHIVGLSEGGAVAVKALRNIDSGVASVTIVSPAELIKGDTPFSLLLRSMAMGPEMFTDFVEHPIVASKLTLSGLANFMTRPAAILSEGLELSYGSLESDLKVLKTFAQPPHVRLIVCSEDRLMPARRLRQAAERLPVDEVIEYSGHNAGHLALIFDRQLARLILRLDQEHAQV